MYSNFYLLLIDRLIYKLCVATPKSHTELLYQKIAAILIDKVGSYRAVTNFSLMNWRINP